MPRPPCCTLEALENRTFFSVGHHAAAGPLLATRRKASVPTNINLSKLNDNEAEGAIAIDPSNPNRMFAASNTDLLDGMFVSRSSDGGKTWSGRRIATGADGLPEASSDPTIAFDNYGNLFFGYLNRNDDNMSIVLSTDGGQTFSLLASIAGNPDQPTITTGLNQVWVTYETNEFVRASGASVTGLGKASIGAFAEQTVPSSSGGSFGDIAIGPLGQVMVTYISPSDSKDADIFVAIDANGLRKGGFAAPVKVTTTHLQPDIPAQPNRTIDAEPGLAWDRSGGVANGRVYLVYTTAGKNRADTDTYLQVSATDGATWSKPYRMNDDLSGNSQFLPRIALDQTTGNFALSWLDCRNDFGRAPGSISVNRTRNDDAQLWGLVGTPTRKGWVLSGNFQISAGASNGNSTGTDFDYGDYTGLALHNGVMAPTWADNSNSTADNPAGAVFKMNLYTSVFRPKFPALV